LLASPLISQIDARIWKDGATWEPVRWNNVEGVAAQALSAYMDEGGGEGQLWVRRGEQGDRQPYQPFGAGKHWCLGEQFAYLQIGSRAVRVPQQGC
ncbi:hypothetical protein B0H14DRAFT_2358788, partial [Mycena olivaceomarginata]